MSTLKEAQRFVGLDVHKYYVVVAAVNADRETVLHPRKVALVDLAAWAQKSLRPTDQVVLEATTNAWYVHDLLKPLVARVVVAHPYHLKVIASAVVKTDKRDALALAKVLAAKMVPTVWVPPTEVRELRALIAHRERLVAQQTAAKNRLQSVLHRHNLVPPDGGLFTPANRTWWDSLKVPTSEKLRVHQDLAVLDALKGLLEEVEAELAHLSTQPPWADQVTYLLQLPGIGLILAMTILAAIGDVTRFPSAKKLVGYSGLGGRVHVSGQQHTTGSITKRGRRELRAALVEAAWAAVQSHPVWQAHFDKLSARIGRKKAIVAIARKLLVVVWHVLTERSADRHAIPEKVAGKFMAWSWILERAWRGDLTTRQFIRYQLLRLGLGDDLTHIENGSRRQPIAPVEEVLRLKPELAPPG